MKIKDPVSALTHFAGAVLSLAAVVQLINRAVAIGDFLHILSFTVFGLSLVALYTASTVYHIMDKPEAMRRIARRIDHMMIFVLIAGTYTPICLVSLNGILGYSLFALIWAIAITGIIMKALWINAPRWLTASLYILMGWLVIFAIGPVLASLPREGFRWLLTGGIIYTIGGIIYALKWPLKNNPWFGFHELFHIFVLGGSFCHYVMIVTYV